MHYDLGRQAYTSGDSQLALNHFAHLLHAGTGVSFQGGILEDYILAWQVSGEFFQPSYSILKL